MPRCDGSDGRSRGRIARRAARVAVAGGRARRVRDGTHQLALRLLGRSREPRDPDQAHARRRRPPAPDLGPLFRGNLAEDGAYLGLPLLLLCLLEARETWSQRARPDPPALRGRRARLRARPGAARRRRRRRPAPWLPLAYIPPFDVLPCGWCRTTLAAGLCVASYLARRTSPARVALALAALAAPFPALAADIWRAPAPIPAPCAVRPCRASSIPARSRSFGGLGHGMLWSRPASASDRPLRPDPPCHVPRAIRGRDARGGRLPRVPAAQRRARRSSSTRPTSRRTRPSSTRSGSSPSGSRGSSSTGCSRLSL